MRHLGNRTLLALALAPALAAQADVCAAFARLSASRRDAVLRRLRAGVAGIESRWVVSMLALSEEARSAARERAELPARRPKGAPPIPPPADDPLPLGAAYSFGRHVIERDARAGGSRGKRPASCGPLRRALLGAVPDADLALSALEARMDSRNEADAFAVFLQTWRNGDESFYEALDRTAGREESLFFYDAMLGDFAARFAAKDREASRSLQAAHDALHRAFLAYRQYRGFREAAALAMVLPPGVAFPSRLSRYEAKAEGGYSLREQVQMVLAAQDWDCAAVASAIAKALPPPPDPLWSAPHDPFPAWRGIFEAHMDRMIEGAGSTDAWLAKARADMQADAQAVAGVARAAAAEPPLLRR
ncbi:MAG: hypothetical protein Fur0037_08130 [Planctomycetota bacterium]